MHGWTVGPGPHDSPREGLEWPYTIGAGGGYPPWAPTRPLWEKTKFTCGKIWSGHFFLIFFECFGIFLLLFFIFWNALDFFFDFFDFVIFFFCNALELLFLFFWNALDLRFFLQCFGIFFRFFFVWKFFGIFLFFGNFFCNASEFFFDFLGMFWTVWSGQLLGTQSFGPQTRPSNTPLAGSRLVAPSKSEGPFSRRCVWDRRAPTTRRCCWCGGVRGLGIWGLALWGMPMTVRPRGRRGGPGGIRHSPGAHGRCRCASEARVHTPPPPPNVPPTGAAVSVTCGAFAVVPTNGGGGVGGRVQRWWCWGSVCLGCAGGLGVLVAVGSPSPSTVAGVDGCVPSCPSPPSTLRSTFQFRPEGSQSAVRGSHPPTPWGGGGGHWVALVSLEVTDAVLYVQRLCGRPDGPPPTLCTGACVRWGGGGQGCIRTALHPLPPLRHPCGGLIQVGPGPTL